jgi:hypothetical protein
MADAGFEMTGSRMGNETKVKGKRANGTWSKRLFLPSSFFSSSLCVFALLTGPKNVVFEVVD